MSAVGVDKLNRVWVGHLNHGVSVWNGEKWKNYGVLDGPLGSRVFAITIHPETGDVWIATDCGVSVYDVEKNEWDYLTKAAGLPSNQIQSIAFGDDNVFVGTQCDGLAFAREAENFNQWHPVTGPVQPAVTATGSGLASNLVNHIAVLRGTFLYVSSPNGLSGGKNDTRWSFIRGFDWLENLNGRLDPPPAPEGMAESGGGFVIAEDWLTCVSEPRRSHLLWFS